MESKELTPTQSIDPIPATEPPHHKPIKFIIVVILLTLAAIVGIVGYQTMQMNKQVEMEQMPVTENPVSDDMSNWETYRNEKYGFETKYNSESAPNEILGNEEEGQFSYLFTVKFGSNPLKFPNGYEVRINNEQSLNNYRLELVGHMTDAIDSEEDISINGNTWIKLNYTLFLTTDYVRVTTAITNHNDYSYAVTASSDDIDQILSTFRFSELGEESLDEQKTVEFESIYDHAKFALTLPATCTEEKEFYDDYMDATIRCKTGEFDIMINPDAGGQGGPTPTSQSEVTLGGFTWSKLFYANGDNEDGDWSIYGSMDIEDDYYLIEVYYESGYTEQAEDFAEAILNTFVEIT